MKKRVTTSLVLTLLLLIPIILINFFMDPMWVFNHNHQYNDYQEAPNERQQKANKLYFTDKKYDTLLLGSSRSTYMNQDAWPKYNVYNFSVGDLYPNEYKHLINFAMQDAQQPIKTVIIGVDFFTYFLSSNSNTLETQRAINKTTSPSYRYKLLLSADTTKLSFKNIRNYFMPSKHINIYSRSNIKLLSKRPNHTERLPDMITRDLRLFKDYKYILRDKKLFRSSLVELKNLFPNINFIVFTTPVSMPLFNMIIEDGYYEAYENWLSELVALFGNVHHFMYKNKITINYPQYFDDAHHTFNSTQGLIIQVINTDRIDKNDDFGIFINKENIKKQLLFLRIRNEMAPSKN